MNLYITQDFHKIIEINKNHLDFYHPYIWFDSEPFQFLCQKEYPDEDPANPLDFLTPKGIRELITGDQKIFDEYYWDIMIEKLKYEISENQKTRNLPDFRFSPENIQKVIFQSKLQRSIANILSECNRMSEHKKIRPEIIYLYKLGLVQPQFISYLSMIFQKKYRYRQGLNYQSIYGCLMEEYIFYMESPKSFFLDWDFCGKFTQENQGEAEDQSEEMQKEMKSQLQ